MIDIIVYYDGQCPFCKSYQKTIEIKKKYSFEIKDARLFPLEILKLKNNGVNIEDGIILILNGQIFQGAEALDLIDGLSSKGKIIQKAYSLIIKLPFFGKIIYPVVKIIRILTLFFMGVKRIK